MALRWALSALFGMAGLGKLLGGEAQTSLMFALLGGDALWKIALAALEEALPFLELAVALSLTVGPRWSWGGATAAMLGLAFLGVNLVMPEGMECGCFGAFGGLEHRGVRVAVSVAVAVAGTVLVLLAAGAAVRGRAAALTEPDGIDQPESYGHRPRT